MVAEAERVSPRPRRYEEDILDATLQVIAEHGVSGATVDTVAARAGVSKATIYRHWGSRAQLIHAAISSLNGPTSNPTRDHCARTSRCCSGTWSSTSTGATSAGSFPRSSMPRSAIRSSPSSTNRPFGVPRQLRAGRPSRHRTGRAARRSRRRALRRRRSGALHLPPRRGRVAGPDGGHRARPRHRARCIQPGTQLRGRNPCLLHVTRRSGPPSGGLHGIGDSLYTPFSGTDGDEID